MLKIALAQLNPVLGALHDNAEKILHVVRDCAGRADLIVFNELSLTGYPIEDLARKPFFVDSARRYAQEMIAALPDHHPALALSTLWPAVDGKVYNAILFIENKTVTAVRPKHELPNYGVFDEVRNFDAGPLPEPVTFKGYRLGLMTCEDMWKPAVTAHLKQNGAEILIAANGSPFETGKFNVRTGHARDRVRESGLPLIYVNQAGGQDEIVFDGASFMLDKNGETVLVCPSHCEHVAITSWAPDKQAGARRILACTAAPDSVPLYDETQSIYQTLLLGLRDYVEKNGFSGVVIGMSGGVDSALTAALAADALGADRVRCVMMPSPHTSAQSIKDAKTCAMLIGAHYAEIPLKTAMEEFAHLLRPAMEVKGLTAENLQARLRGVILMALSNASGDMVLATGNKSETAVGYATLYGDMCGGFAPLKDVYKTLVYELCRWRNAHFPDHALGREGRVIPETILSKPPTAELRDNQKDEDTLPPYDALDDILYCLIECDTGLEEITARGHDRETVNEVWRLLDGAEFKRRQGAPGIKITAKAFGRDRRYPITSGFISLLDD
ncbi:MAG: NAD+ synthase [Micavibrio sp.]|nr:MAG: NAD+ synthase [Micavibrio sp.]